MEEKRPIPRRQGGLRRGKPEGAAVGARLAAGERMRHDDRLRTVGELASGVAHELGTSLSVVGARARLIASGEVTGAEITANATAILEQIDRMTRLVRQLLDYSRRSAAQATTVDLPQAALQTVEMLEPLARSHGVTFAADVGSDAVVVRADPAQLQQVLTNLALNSIQAMPTGGRLEIRCGQSTVTPPERGGRVAERCWIRIADEGPGIPPEDLPHLFEPFFTTKPPGEGTGLGLAVALAIVEEHGGSIAVRSEPGHGAEWTVYLPRAVEAATDPPAS